MLKKMMSTYTNVSLRTLAAACSVNYNYLLKLSHKPIKGEVYDPEATNFDEIEAMLARKGVDLKALNWEELNEKSSPARQSFLTKDIEAYKVGTPVWLRRDNETPFIVVYTTETHVVTLQEGTTKPSVMNWDTFLQQGPSLTPRMVKEFKEPKEPKTQKK